MSVLARTLPSFVPSYDTVTTKEIAENMTIVQPNHITHASELPYAQKPEKGEGSHDRNDTTERHQSESLQMNDMKIVSVNTHGPIHIVSLQSKYYTGFLMDFPLPIVAEGTYELPHERTDNDRAIPELISMEA